MKRTRTWLGIPPGKGHPVQEITLEKRRWVILTTFNVVRSNCMKGLQDISLAAIGDNLAKIPPNQVTDDFGRGSSVESETE